jgi:hypothetical protein
MRDLLRQLVDQHVNIQVATGEEPVWLEGRLQMVGLDWLIMGFQHQEKEPHYEAVALDRVIVVQAAGLNQIVTKQLRTDKLSLAPSPSPAS